MHKILHETAKTLEMRLFVIFHVLGVILLTSKSQAIVKGERYKHYMDVMINCTKEHGITLEAYIFASPKRNTDGTFDKAKCVDACMFKVHKIMNPNGTIDYDMTMEHLLTRQSEIRRDNMRKRIDSCTLNSADNECETAHKLMTCALGNN